MTPNIDFLKLLPTVSSISLGYEKPISALGIRSRSLEPANKSLLQLIPLLTHSNCGDDVNNKASVTAEDTCRLSEIPQNNVFRTKTYDSKCNMEVRCITDINILENEDNQKVKKKIHQHKINPHRQHLRALSTKQRQELRAKISPNLSRLNRLKVKLSLMRHCQVIETDMTVKHVLTPQFMIPKNKEKAQNHDTEKFHQNTNSYKGHLFTEIISWLLNIPVFYSLDFTPQTLKSNFADPLANKLEQLLNEGHDSNYETKAKKEINDCLDVLPMWLPYTKTERLRFKNELCEKFYKKLKRLNKKYINRQNNEKDDDETTCKCDTKSEIEISRQKDIISSAIHNWLNKIPFDKPMFRLHIVEFMMKRLSPLLSINNYKTSYKLMLKAEIVEMLRNLPIKYPNGKNRLLYLNKIVEELTCRLMRLKLQFLCNKQIKDEVVYKPCTNKVKGVPVYNNLVDIVHSKVNKALENTKVQNKKDVEREICGIVLNSIETLRTGLELNTNIQIFDILRRLGNIDEDTAMKIAKNIKIYIKIALIQDKETNKCSTQCIQYKAPDVISIYRSSIDDPVTSTPKQPTKKHVSRLNVEETSYMEKVAALIRSSMDTLPVNLDDDENKEYKNIMIYDLAGDIMDELKREQLSSEINKETDKHLKYFVFRWLVKFGIFDDLNDAKPWVEQLFKNLQKISVPDLTAPQYGSRQAMENIKLVEGEFGWEKDFVPRGIDILEDQISVWLNEQPAEIYNKCNKKNHNKLVKKLAFKLQDNLRNNSPESQIETDINDWLKNIINNNEKENLGLLTQDLKEKIINVPQDRTLEARNIKRQQQKEEYRQKAPTAASPSAEQDTISSPVDSSEKTLKEFIIKYIEHNYDVDDLMVRAALSELLLIELRKLVPPAKNKVCANYAKCGGLNKFRPEQLNEVLEYIKIISDWLKDLPIHPLYNTPGHRPRVDFVNDLARNIQEIEDKRKESPDAMDYDLYLSSVIGESIRTYNIPLHPEQKHNINMMVDQLLLKIIANRSVINKTNLSFMSDITEQNLSAFIQDYIRLNGREIADDEVKLEAWTARLLEEVKKINEDADPRIINKAQIYEKFSEVQIPEDEPVKRFNSEMLYVKEISDWLKNFPLCDNSYESQKERTLMITELAKKIAYTNAINKKSPSENTKINDKQLEDYITTWIYKLPLDPRKAVVVPILIQQLLKRIIRVDKPDEIFSEDFSGEEIFPTRSEPKNFELTRDPGTHMVQFIEDWCNKLPIGEDSDVNVKHMKSNIARNLYKRIGELNIDPKIYNDNVLFKELLEDEIDTQLENVPQTTELQNGREQLKIVLVDTVLDMKNVIKEKSTGDDYKRKLETSIEASIPNPVHSRQIIEPGFEIYKNHLASMFILDNFDHSDDEVKAKYEKKIRAEVDKYFISAVNKNALPISKDKLYNELYSELFKVPMPKKESIGDKVEEIKTRYEIDAWFYELPIRRTDDLIEQLEWDRILSTLAERIHDIEKYEPNPDEKIRTEIIKWLLKLPLQKDNNFNHYVDKLQNILRASETTRKYVPYDPKNKGKNVVQQNKPVNKSHNINQNPCLSCKSKQWVSSSLAPVCKPKKSGDLIVEIIEEWCNQLPLIGDKTEINMLKDELSTKIVIKVCELNNDSEIFNDDVLYDQLLDEALSTIISDITVNDEFEASKPARKHQLKERIKSVIPFINEEKQRYQYKTELNDVVTNVLKDHSNTNEKIMEFDKLTNDIVDYFIEYNYNRDDDEAKQIYKTKLYNAVVDFFQNVNKPEEDPLVIKNQLLCELSKIPVPNDTVLQELIEETKMKKEVNNLFESTALDDNSEKTAHMKTTLCKRLIDIEKLGHSEYSDNKMSSEITKCLNKLNKSLPPKVIDDFVNSLRDKGIISKTPALRKYNSNENVMNRQTPTIDTYRSRSPDDTVSRQMSLPCPGCYQPLCTPDQLASQYSQVPEGRSHLSQTRATERTGPRNQNTGYYDSSAIQRNQTASNQMILKDSPFDQYPPRIYEQPQAAPFLHSPVAPIEYEMPVHRDSVPLSVSAHVSREMPPPCSYSLKRNSIPRRSLQEAPYKYRENLSGYQKDPDSDPYVTEYQRSYSPSPRTNTFFEPNRSSGHNNYRRGSTDNQNQSLNFKPNGSYGQRNYPCGSECQHQHLNYKPNGSSSQSNYPFGTIDNQDQFLNYRRNRNRAQSSYPCGASEYQDPSLSFKTSRSQSVSSQSNYPSEMTNSRNRSFNYDNFKGRSILASTPILKPDIKESGGNSSRLSEPSIFRGPSYEQASTPRRVQGEAQAVHPSASRDITPDSLFHGPTFIPAPLFTTPPLPGRDIYRGYPPITSPPRLYKMAQAGNMSGHPEMMDFDEQIFQCVCGNRVKALFSGGRFFMIPMQQYCDRCSGFIPIWGGYCLNH